MARRDRPADDGTELRRYLVAEAEEFRRVLCGIDPQFWDELSKPVDALGGIESYTLHRWELPEDHPGHMDGAISDLLVLTADDELLPRE